MQSFESSCSGRYRLIAFWVGNVIQIKQLNTLLNQRAIEICQIWQEAGFRCCVLKGQGNAEMYPDPSLRMPGDIDLWIDADEQSIQDFVIKQFPDAKECYKHIKYPIFDDVQVDIHQTPLKFRCPLHQQRLQRWIQLHKKEQFGNRIKLTGTDSYISVPTVSFNAVYQLGHIMIHLFDEGIGFRHLVDFFYVLKKLDGLSQEGRDEIIWIWKRVGLLRLASAVMWIESEKMGLPERCMLTVPSRRLGKILLRDVLEGGNFGRYSIRQEYAHSGKRLARRTSTLWRLIRLSPCFPIEAFFWIKDRSTAVIKHDLGII